MTRLRLVSSLFLSVCFFLSWACPPPGNPPDLDAGTGACDGVLFYRPIVAVVGTAVEEVPTKAIAPEARGPYGLVGTLPAGLVFDPASAAISGTPTSTSPMTDYTVTTAKAGFA